MKAGPAYVYPNPLVTPGAVFTTDASTICAPGYASGVRDVSTATKKEVYAEYGVSYPQASGAYEVDHLIPLEIGGRLKRHQELVAGASDTHAGLPSERPV
jgi:hypothetical protein